MNAKKSAAVGQPLKRMNFDVPEDLAHEFKAYAALQGKTQREIIAFMQRCTRKGSNRRHIVPTSGEEEYGRS
ncbi:hypothetical protein ACX8Z9_13375 [Arthrobacter halodurans]|uniref:MSP domain-containing protein n=1 Tax=Arthrobacter halodurans TaxID=516699 RepID=A0ABV4URJ2_9MICC